MAKRPMQSGASSSSTMKRASTLADALKLQDVDGMDKDELAAHLQIAKAEAFLRDREIAKLKAAAARHRDAPADDHDGDVGEAHQS
eukprot:3185122-Karenia_brevis.AAC.1